LKININLAKDCDMRGLNNVKLNISYEKLIEDLMKIDKFSNTPYGQSKDPFGSVTGDIITTYSTTTGDIEIPSYDIAKLKSDLETNKFNENK